MAQGFKLVLRPSKPGEKDSEKKFYAVSKTNGTSSMGGRHEEGYRVV